MYNILIVDDSLLNRKLIIEVLDSKIDNSRYIQATDGNDAIEIIKTNEVDLIILDLMMPNKDGYEVLSEIKKNPLYQDIPVIVNSSINDMDSIKKTLKLGAIDYFTKPLSLEQMEVILPLKVENTLKFYEQNKKLKIINNNIKKELMMAGTFQKALIDMYKGTSFKGLDISIFFKPCKEISGDLFEIVENSGVTWFIISDIKAQGAAAAMMSFMVRKLFNNTIKKENNPKDVLNTMNRIYYDLMENTDLVYFSVCVGKIQNNTLTYSNAGNPYLIKLSVDKNDCKRLEHSGHFIGFMDDSEYEQEEIKLENDNCILLHTDGLYQGKMNPKINLNIALDNIINVYSENQDIEKLTLFVYNEFIAQNEELEDDTTVIAIKIQNNID